MSTRTRFVWLAIIALVAGSFAPAAHGQRRRARHAPVAPVDQTETTDDTSDATVERAATGGTDRLSGYELELHGTASVHAGRVLHLRGVAYEVIGLATLRPLPHARIVAHEIRDGRVAEQPLGEATGDGAGRFDMALSAASEIDVTVGSGSHARTFRFNIAVRTNTQIELLTDRVLYEPGETVHVWTRLTDIPSGAPVRDAPVDISVAGNGSVTDRLGANRTRTAPSGVATLDVPIPSSAPDGALVVRAQADANSAGASTVIRIGRRTVERLMADAQVDQQVVAPGARVTGRVTVRTPSGSPVRNARVEVRVSERDAPIVVETDAQGVARFALNAPAYLASPIATQSLDVRVVHRAYGTIRTATSFTLARVPYAIEAMVGSGGIVPEVESTVYLTLTDPRGSPPPTGTVVTVTGEGLAGRRFAGATDANGMLAVPFRLPSGGAALHAQGACAGQVSTSFDVEVASTVPVTARLCARVAATAQVLVRVNTPVVVPGGRIDVTIERRPSVRARAVAIDLLHRSVDGGPATVLGSAIVAANETHATITAPAPYIGAVLVRARPVDEQSVGEGTGSTDAVLVRPAHAFALQLTPERTPYHVRESARIVAHTPAGIEHGSIALVARDLAAHGGEQPFALAWLRGALAASVTNPSEGDNARLVRVALAALLAEDPAAIPAPPLVPPVGGSAATYVESEAVARGDLRDPFAQRDELLRRGIASAMTAIEDAVAEATSGESHGIFSRGPRRGFDPAIVHTLTTTGSLGSAETLGGGAMTVAMLERADPSFTFDHVARRIARKKLVQLLASIAAFLDPESGDATAAAHEPPDRWLSRMVSRGMITAGDLRDPWGGTFALRRVAAGHEAVAIAVPAAGWELTSPGPDGVRGNGDDVRDPFERVVPSGTVYAIASNEDTLIRELAGLDPGADVLDRIVAAYQRIASGADEEQRGDATTATMSDAVAPAGMAGLSLGGAGEGGGGQGYGAGRGAMARAMPMGAPAPVSIAEGAIDQDRSDARRRHAANEPTAPPPPPPSSGPRMAQLAALVRERFPATLRFIADAPIDASGNTTLEIPLADALTTYRVEAIAWTSEGWTTSAGTDVRVDQDAVIDAPVPPFVTVGDDLRLPLRLSNRTTHPIRARVSVSAEGGLAVDAGAPSEVTVAPGDASEVPMHVHMRAAGHGALVVNAVDAASGAGLDAARRPIEVLADARPVRMAADALVDGHARLALDVPSDASFRAEGSVRVTVGEAIFGDPRVWGPVQPDPTWPGWAIALGGAAPSDALLSAALAPYADRAVDPDAYGVDAAAIARGVSTLWYAHSVDDATIGRGLASMTRAMEGYERLPRASVATQSAREAIAAEHTRMLLGLAPAFRGATDRPSLAEPLRRLIARLHRSVESNTSVVGDDVMRYALAAAALTLTSTAVSSRAQEFMRRAQRSVVRVGDDLFIDAGPGDAVARVAPSATFGLASLGTGDRATAFAIARTLARTARAASRWSLESRSLAAALLARLTPANNGAVRASVRIMIDGTGRDVPMVNGVATLGSREISQPGHHVVEVTLPPGTTLIAEAESRYGRPWSVAPPARGPLTLTLDGPVGVRDARAGLVLRLQNRGPRVIGAPVVEIDVPAGAELDEETRRDLQRRTAHAPTLSGRTLVLTLRALAPGGFARIPLALRWSVGGTLRGLGVGAYVSDEPGAAATVLPSRALEVPDSAPSGIPGAANGGAR